MVHARGASKRFVSLATAIRNRQTAWEPSSKRLEPYPSPSETDVQVAVMKVGQYPEPSVDLPKALEKNLGKDAAALYRKGLICRNYGYGLAAAVYIRRVVEDKTNELIEVAAQLAESHDVAAESVARMREIGSSTEYTRYEDKLQVAATVFPDSLRVGGMNPLKDAVWPRQQSHTRPRRGRMRRDSRPDKGCVRLHFYRSESASRGQKTFCRQI